MKQAAADSQGIKAMLDRIGAQIEQRERIDPTTCYCPHCFDTGFIVTTESHGKHGVISVGRACKACGRGAQRQRMIDKWRARKAFIKANPRDAHDEDDDSDVPF